MADNIVIQCPGCSKKLAVSDASKLGKKIRCSKCSEVFVAKPLNAAGSKPAKAKPKKSEDDEFNFDDLEMEDTSSSENDKSGEASRPARAKKSTKSKGKGKKKSSGRNLPIIIGGVIAVVLLVGAGGYFLFSGGEPKVAPAQAPVDRSVAGSPVAQTQQPQTNTPPTVADTSNVPAAAVVNAPPQVPATGQQPTAVATEAIPIRADSKSPTDTVDQKAPAAAADAESLRLGETEPTLVSGGVEMPPEISKLIARTRWYWAPGFDSMGQPVDVVELLVDVQGETLSNACAFGKAQLKMLTVAPNQRLSVYKSIVKIPFDPVSDYIPYDSRMTPGLYGHAANVLRVAVPIVAPKMAATHLALADGQFKIRVGKMVEEIVIPDLRAAANQPLEHPSLKAADAMLWIRTVKNAAGAMQEAIEFKIGTNHAVGPMLVQSQTFSVLLEPDLAVDPNGRHYSSRNTLRLPAGQLTLNLKLYGQLEEVVVPFRFENVPLPSSDKKPTGLSQPGTRRN